MMRIDKLISNMGYGSRKEVKSLIKQGEVSVNDILIDNSSVKISPISDIVKIAGEIVEYKEHIYIMMNKPKGYISATEDNMHKTVLDILDEKYLIYRPYPAGRLDIDTTGLLIITNDGDLTHNIISPKKEIVKRYEAYIQGRVGESEIEAFKNGIYLDKEDYHTLPAKLEIIQRGEISKVIVSIKEGKYHQVKRMFESVGMRVIDLKRLSIGWLDLDEDLAEGDYRELEESEINKLIQIK